MVSFSRRNSNDDDEDGEDDSAGHKEVALPLSQLPLLGERIQWVDGVHIRQNHIGHCKLL